MFKIQYVNILVLVSLFIASLRASDSRVLWWQGRKRKESLQLRLWNLNSTSNSPMAPPKLSSQISANECKVYR